MEDSEKYNSEMIDRLNIPLSGALVKQVSRIQVDYQSYIDSLPSNVQPLVMKMDLNDISMSPGRISVLALPFWIGEAFNVEFDIQRGIALANVYGLLHFLAQDRLMDGNWQHEEIPALVLSETLYHQQLLTNYQRYFHHQSPFWDLLNKYWLEWAESTTWERLVGLCPKFVEEDLERAARKAAPLKICTSGLALLGNREELIPDLERAVDLMHMVMQMADDLADMAEDLAGNRFNTALSLMVSRGTLDPQDNFTINQIGKAMFTSGDDVVYFQMMDDIVAEAQDLLLRMGLPQWTELIHLTAKQSQTWRNLVVNELIPTNLEQLFEEAVTENYKSQELHS